MTYIPEGSGIDYGCLTKLELNQKGMSWKDAEKEAWQYAPKIKNYYAWGWIQNEVPSNLKGWKDPVEKQKFLDYLKANGKGSMHYFGEHECLICGKEEFCGSLIILYNGIIYRAPWNVSHYIREHDYNPGEEVINAVMHGMILDDDNKTKEEWQACHFVEDHINKNKIEIIKEKTQKKSILEKIREMIKL